MTQQQGNVGEEIAIREVIDAWAAAVRRKDYDSILANHTADFVMFDVPPPFESKGLAAYRETWDTFFGWSSEPIQFDVQEMKVIASRDVAFAFATMRCAGPGADGKVGDLEFRLTIGLRKVEGRWAIAHEHHSIPAES